MKKIVLFIILFFSFLNFVNGETYYGKFRLVDDIKEYKDDLLKIETFKLYNTYKTNYIDMGYMVENDIYIKDENDFKEEYTNVDVNDFDDEYINIKNNIEKVHYIIIYLLDSNVKINELEIYDKEQKLYYEFSSNSKELNKMKDNNLDTYADCSKTNGFYLRIFNSYKVSDLTIKIFTDDFVDYDLKLVLSNDESFITLHNNDKNVHIISFNNNEKIEDKITYEYKGIKKLYKHYKEEKEPLNHYIESGENIILDDYIEISNYYVRDKIEIEDNIIINDLEQQVIDSIEYSSNNVDIKCDIDYEVNGIYTCDFILNDIYFRKNVIVDIPVKEEIIENDTLTKDTYVDNYEIKYEKVNNIKEEIKIEKLTSDSNNKVLDKPKEKNSNKKNRLLNIIKYILIINLVIIEILLFIKKKKK